MQKAIFGMIGVDCAACGALIEKEVKKLEGVRSASVNPANGRLYVDYDERLLGAEKIAELLAKAGYKSIIISR